MSPCKINGITENGEEKIFTVDDFWENYSTLFYPNDWHPGCTIQAGDFRDNMKYLKQKAAVAGVNRDSIQSHKNL